MATEQQVLMFLEALKRLSAPAEQQARYLTESGSSPSTDELALEFDDLYQVVRPSFSATVRDSLDLLDHKLESMSPGNDELWHVDSLEHSADWAQVRQLALKALSEL